MDLIQMNVEEALKRRKREVLVTNSSFLKRTV